MFLISGGILLLTAAGYQSALLAWADHLSRSADVSRRLRAVHLAPAMPLFYERLADLHEALARDSLPDLDRAADLDPTDARLWQRLGIRSEGSGKYPLAEFSLLRAAALSRLYQPRYLLAEYYFRRQNADSFFRWTCAAFETAYGDVMPLFDLCWRMRPDAVWLADHVVPGRRETVRLYLQFLVRRHDQTFARTLANRLCATARAADLPALLEYVESRLAARDRDAALEVWNALCRRGLLSYRPLDPSRGASLTNGDFASPPSNVGFDWRIEKHPGIEVGSAPDELRLTFSGEQPEMTHIGVQDIPTAPGTRYGVRFVARSPDGSPAEGLRWSVYVPGGPQIAADEAADGSLAFTAPADLLQLIFFYQRPRGSPRLQGTIALTGVRLVMQP